MENIYEGCTENEKEEIIHDLESNFTSVFQQLVEKTEESETEGNRSLGSTTGQEISSSNKVDEDECEDHEDTQIKRSQTNSTIVQRNLELHLSSEAQQRIQDILNDVRQLSEKEKLLLYLKLPTKTGSLSEESQPIPLSNTRQEQTQAFQWIRLNLEECEGSHTLPKHEVYDDYKSYCESLGANRTLSAPDFGKIIKCVFPKVKARRLGTRGNSKYCYSGLRKKVIKESPSLPNLNSKGEEVNNNSSNNNSLNDCSDLTEDQTLSAACNLVREWANKLLGRVFTTLLDLARFLVGGSYVSTKSMAAFVVMSATESKVRKMSEKLKFHSSTSQAKNSHDSVAAKIDERRPRLDAATPSSFGISSNKTKTSNVHINSHAQPKSCYVGNQYPLPSNVKPERPLSLPGLQVATGNQGLMKVSNQLMSPPPCPPPKTTHQIAKGSPIVSTPPAFSSPIRGNLLNPMIPTNDGSFPVLSPNTAQHSPRFMPQGQIPTPEIGPITKRSRAVRNQSMLKRSDSCPYPSQSPRATRQVAVSPGAVTLSPRQPADAIRHANWQAKAAMGSPHQSSQHPNVISPPESAIQSMRDFGKIMQEQQQQQQIIASPVRNTAMQEAMITPTNRQPPVQRCHSVPVPFSSPHGEVYQPMTPQLGPQNGHSPAGTNRSVAYNNLKDMRTKLLSNEIQSPARRNLLPFLSGNDVMNMNKSRTMGIRNQTAIIDNSATGRIPNMDSLNDSKVPDRKTIEMLNKGSIVEGVVISNPNNPGCYNTIPNCNPIGSSPDRKLDISIAEESSLASVDSLIDSPFSIADIVTSGGCENSTSGGSGLSDLDGLDDAVTIDLLRSLNSGNNIWVNEWNSTNMQLMESN